MMKRRLTYAKVLNGSEAVLHQTLILEVAKGQLPMPVDIQLHVLICWSEAIRAIQLHLEKL